MKITKRQLRRIIREERKRMLVERTVGLIPGIGFGRAGFNSQRSRYGTGESSQLPAAIALHRSKITRRQLRKLIKESLGDALGGGAKAIFSLGKLIEDEENSVDEENSENIEESALRLIVRAIINETFPGAAPSPAPGADPSSEWEWTNIKITDADEKIMEPTSFRIPYRNYGYNNRRIISRDRAWLEFVPRGTGAMTSEDMFRAVTLLEDGDPEVLKAIKAGAPKSMSPLEAYDVYSVYATTTG